MKIGLNPIDRLIRALQGQRTIYAALLSLYKEHFGDIKEWNLVALKPLLYEEQRLMRELNLLEQRRLAAVTRLASSLGVPPTEVKKHLTHKQLLELLEQTTLADEDPQEKKQQLKRLADLGIELAAAMQELTTAREPLLPLLQNALEYIDRNDPDRASEPSVYEADPKTGRRPTTRTTPVLDKKV
ncbi:MAG: flagellar protein FlgN [Symbiobacteriaceae bacterium]|nr:flagellar protein FlgN [Symbiobacteriaceae bacterium]